MTCSLPYIPSYLHKNNRLPINTFSKEESLYRRCEEDTKADPFGKISLVDLSHNRSGNSSNLLSRPEDVLYNTNPSQTNQKEKFDMAVITLRIIDLDGNNQYSKTFYELQNNTTETSSNNSQINCLICLKHKPEECNYSHCTFEFHFMGTEVTYENYKSTLGQKGAAVTKLRTACKNEISKMIIREEILLNAKE